MGQVELTEQNFLWGAENIKEEYDLNMVKNFWTNQISILGACKSHNISHHLYIQPNYFWGQKQTLTADEKKGKEADHKLLKKKYEESIKKSYQDILEEKKKYEHHFNGGRYILKSFFEVFNEDKNQCYVDFSHLSDYGQSILADKIKENIISSKILDY